LRLRMPYGSGGQGVNGVSGAYCLLAVNLRLRACARAGRSGGFDSFCPPCARQSTSPIARTFASAILSCAAGDRSRATSNAGPVVRVIVAVSSNRNGPSDSRPSEKTDGGRVARSAYLPRASRPRLERKRWSSGSFSGIRSSPAPAAAVEVPSVAVWSKH
jgi:hypothetical protein